MIAMLTGDTEQLVVVTHLDADAIVAAAKDEDATRASLKNHRAHRAIRLNQLNHHLIHTVLTFRSSERNCADSAESVRSTGSTQYLSVP